MNIDLRPFMALWAVLAVVVIVMIVYRRAIARREDDSLHVLADAGMVPQQAAFAHKIEAIDKWGKILTVVTVVFGLILGAMYVYQTWVAMSHIGV